MGQTFVYNTGNSKASVDELHLQFGMFFDGTINNMKYTELREKYLTKGNDIKPDDDEETIGVSTTCFLPLAPLGSTCSASSNCSSFVVRLEFGVFRR